MDQKSIETVELPKILARLATYAAFSASQRLALDLVPSPDPVVVADRLALTSEAKSLLSAHADLTVGGARDVRERAGQAAKGALLQPGEFLDIRQTLLSGRRLRRLITRQQERHPRLAEIAARIEPAEALVDAIGAAIDEDGNVRDGASPRLGRLRRDLETAHHRLTERLQQIAQSPANARYLQEPLVTQRGGRYVIPLKVEYKSRIPGVVHDQSASGATLFIEPLATVDLNNSWRELEIATQREIERILRELSALVGEAEGEIVATVVALARIDLALAMAAYAFDLRAREPFLTDPEDRETPLPYLDLRQARHPLLDPEQVVPNDIVLGPGYHVLVITGPNTGGKTVTLKSVALLALMAQCGLHIPAADGSRLPVLDGVFADIGDEQSIEQSLSTFSSHLANIRRILDNATARSLVVLDEVGAGTDPVEGSALARALLDHFLEHDISALVATHYSALKVYAHGTSQVRNASVEFDLETLRPTFQLTIGLPGRSNALNIAERLGLPAPIVARARSYLSQEEMEVDDLLGEIKSAREAARQDQRLAEEERLEAETRREEWRAQVAGIEEERRRVINQTRQEATEEVEQVKEELRRLTRRLERYGGRRDEVTEVRNSLQQLEEQLRPISELVPRRISPIDTSPRPLEVGDLVWVPSLDRTGELLSISGDEGEIQAGSFRVRVPLEALELRAPAGDRSAPREPRESPSIGLPRIEAPPLEIDLRGQSVDEMLPQLERYLDDAYLSGLPWITIIHGKGTGALRRAVRDEMRDHPLVASFRSGALNEGGDGVTIATLSER